MKLLHIVLIMGIGIMGKTFTSKDVKPASQVALIKKLHDLLNPDLNYYNHEGPHNERRGTMKRLNNCNRSSGKPLATIPEASVEEENP